MMAANDGLAALKHCLKEVWQRDHALTGEPVMVEGLWCIVGQLVGPKNEPMYLLLLLRLSCLHYRQVESSHVSKQQNTICHALDLLVWAIVVELRTQSILCFSCKLRAPRPCDPTC